MVFFVLNWCLLVVALGISSVMTNKLGMGFHIQANDFTDIVKLFWAVALFSVLNMTVGRIIKLILLPVSCLTFGLSSLIVNALMLEIINTLSFGIKLDNFFAAIMGAFFITLSHYLMKNTAKMALR